MVFGALLIVPLPRALLLVERRPASARSAPSELPAALTPWLVGPADEGYRLALTEYTQLEHVMAVLRSAGTQVLEMEVLQPDLEEVFVKLMKEQRA